ncbi:MAG: thioredoxin-disulfide reductase [Flavobacteriaceae bacterium]|nr:thioredoxin-disulfide reductase [Flavobacteriaceae bacterium]MCB0474661.1 thioredoxin-disulfide reductase [Flavobacteriaceae bacterium]
MEHFDTIILGGGPAGLTAGIYLSRARNKTLILNQGAVGGQMILTHEIANYPGVERISGYQLANSMKTQAKSFGCKIRSLGEITELDLQSPVKKVTIDGVSSFTADSVIIATGGRSRTLGVPGEAEFKGRGISYCATCDGDFFTDKEILVVGGGNSALEEAVSLTKYASKVTVVHQFDHFQAFEHAVKEASDHPKIDFVLESTISAFYGNEKLESVDILNLKTYETRNVPIDGVFVFIGYVPNTEFLKDTVKRNQWGEIIVDPDLRTNYEGVYAAGDCIVKKFRQVSTAVGDGTAAALSVANYLNELKTQAVTL